MKLNNELSTAELELSDHAFSILKAWEWVQYDPDGFPSESHMWLSEVLNRLAFEGLSNPKQALLLMLIRGQLEATADFRWSKYQLGETYNLGDVSAPVSKAQWAKLRGLLVDEQQRFLKDEHYKFRVDLEKLGEANVDVVSWEPASNQFSFAICPHDTSVYDQSYLEESFSARNIEIFPASSPASYQEPPSFNPEDSFAQDATADTRAVGRRPKYDWPASCLAVFGLIHRGDLKPENQAEVERALIAHLSDENGGPSESTVRPYAKMIWEESLKA